MDRKRHHKLPIIEKHVHNPFADLKPGVYLPVFRLYGLDKATDEATVTCYNETDYVEHKNKNKKEFKMGCEIRLSECTPKAVNLRQQSQRRLQQTLNDISKQRHTTLRENDIMRQKILNENTMKVKRTTIPLDSLDIPGWRFKEDVCKCYKCDTKTCPVHWAKLNKRKEMPKPPSIMVQRKISVISNAYDHEGNQHNGHSSHDKHEGSTSKDFHFDFIQDTAIQRPCSGNMSNHNRALSRSSIARKVNFENNPHLKHATLHQPNSTSVGKVIRSVDGKATRFPIRPKTANGALKYSTPNQIQSANERRPKTANDVVARKAVFQSYYCQPNSGEKVITI